MEAIFKKLCPLIASSERRSLFDGTPDPGLDTGQWIPAIDGMTSQDLPPSYWTEMLSLRRYRGSLKFFSEMGYWKTQ
jgi:hypothetical protein